MNYYLLPLTLVLGFFLAYIYYKKASQSKVEGAESRAEKILSEAKTKQKKYELETQEKALKIIEEAKREEASRRKEINNLQRRLEQRETAFSQKLLALEEKQQKDIQSVYPQKISEADPKDTGRK